LCVAQAPQFSNRFGNHGDELPVEEIHHIDGKEEDEREPGAFLRTARAALHLNCYGGGHQDFAPAADAW